MPIEKLLVKNICNLLQTEVEDVLASLMCGPRSKEQVDVAKRVLSELSQLTGEDCSLDSPSNGVQRVLVFLADQVGVWAVDTVEEADLAAVERRRREIYGEGIPEESGHDSDDDDDGKSPGKKSKKGQVKKTTKKEVGHGDGGKDGAKGRPPTGTSKRDLKTSKNGDNQKTGDENKKNEMKQKGKQDDKRKSTVRPAGEGGGEKSDDKKKVETTDKKPPPRPSVVNSKARKSERTSKDIEGKSSKRKQSNVRGVKQSIVKRPSTGSPPGTSKTEVKPRPSSAGAGKRPSRPTNARPSTEGVSKPKTSSEIRKKTMDDMLAQYLSKVITEAGPGTKNPRQEALQEVIDGKLRDTLRPRDNETREAIKAASVTVSAFIDKLATTVDLEYGLRGQMPPKTGTVFLVKPAKHELSVRPLSFKDSRLKTYKARGLTVPGKQPKNEWASWTDDAVDLAEQWAKWLDKTVAGAVATAEKRKAGQDVDPQGWKDWKTATETEALEWRKSKKQLNAQAELMRQKVKPAPTDV
ncbi:Hypothetical protein NTJ_06919 [Nesidiocoris tenuis]|uniref:Uncharacterized protein n=1 Tax=Nesidiocoris tenuis TaxID=355587 RepID=A0ABN7AT48_9HEMI|nr:Hypothetical protein NTJ_06919 [Nesidiocoris tenuis]